MRHRLRQTGGGRCAVARFRPYENGLTLTISLRTPNSETRTPSHGVRIRAERPRQCSVGMGTVDGRGAAVIQLVTYSRTPLPPTPKAKRLFRMNRLQAWVSCQSQEVMWNQ